MWKEIKLDEFLTQKKRHISIEPDIEYSLVTISNKGKVKLREVKKGATISAQTGYIAKEGDFIYSRLAVHTGAFGIVPAELDGAFITGEMPCFEINKNKILPEILVKMIELPGFLWQLKQLTKGMGRVRIKENMLLSTSLIVPDIKQQKEIVGRIKSVETEDDKLKIELTYQQTLIKKLRQQILQEAMEGKLTAEWRKIFSSPPKEKATKQGEDKYEHASVLLERIIAEKNQMIKDKKTKIYKTIPPISDEDKPFPLPPGWVWCRLGVPIFYADNLDIQKEMSAETIINYVDIDCIDNSKQVIKKIKKRRVAELSTRARRVLKNGFMVYSTVRPYLKNIAIIENELPQMIGTTGFNVFKPIQINIKYIFYFLLSPNLNKEYEEMMIGFNSPSISNMQFENTLLPLPPLAEQKAIVAKVEKLLALCDQLETKIAGNKTRAEQLMRAVLKEAFAQK